MTNQHQAQQPNPAPQQPPQFPQQPAQPQQVQAQTVEDKKGFGWGHLLAAGVAGFVFGILLNAEEPKPEPQKHFWQ